VGGKVYVTERCSHGVPLTSTHSCDHCELIWLKFCHEGARERLERRERRIAFLEMRILSQECGDA